MTQEDKQLLVVDLCSRLPYGVKVLCLRNFNRDWYNLEMVDIGDNEVYLTAVEPYTNRYAEIETIKPYLFPISSMTDEQRKEFLNIQSEERKTLLDAMVKYRYEKEDKIPIIPTQKHIDFFHKNHIDYRELIPKGLAIDATNLNIY